MRFAFVSDVFPPSWSGQAVMIGRLLGGIDPSRYCLVSSLPEDPPPGGQSPQRPLPATHHRLGGRTVVTGGRSSALRNVAKGATFAVELVRRATAIARVVRRERCTAVVACSGGGDPLNLPGAYLASRLTGTAFYPYLFDDYSRLWAGPRLRVVARVLEPAVLKGAAGLVAPNEFLRDELNRRYGVNATVIHNPCDISEYDGPPPSRGDDGVRMVYTGAVSESHYDALLSAVAGVELLGRPDVRLHVYTAQSARQLADEVGIRGPVVFHQHEPPGAMPGVQRTADILLLPLAFRSPYPNLIRTSAPAKMGEYLAARRPVLVHAPRDSFVSHYFRRHECGLVVDEPSPALVAEAIGRLLDDEPLRRTLAENAWQRAKADFDVSVARSTFAQLLALPRATA
jgi:glycosyltransferase involved in cell wall biosynthesis